MSMDCFSIGISMEVEFKVMGNGSYWEMVKGGVENNLGNIGCPTSGLLRCTKKSEVNVVQTTDARV